MYGSTHSSENHKASLTQLFFKYVPLISSPVLNQWVTYPPNYVINAAIQVHHAFICLNYLAIQMHQQAVLERVECTLAVWSLLASASCQECRWYQQLIILVAEAPHSTNVDELTFLCDLWRIKNWLYYKLGLCLYSTSKHRNNIQTRLRALCHSQMKRRICVCLHTLAMLFCLGILLSHSVIMLSDNFCCCFQCLFLLQLFDIILFCSMLLIAAYKHHIYLYTSETRPWQNYMHWRQRSHFTWYECLLFRRMQKL